MLGTASRLALSGLFLSFVIAAPAAAQSRSDGAPGCYRTIADRSGEAAPSRPAAGPECSAPRERVIFGGWLSHAIMLVGDPGQLSVEQPAPATAWRTSRPAFVVPPTVR